MVEKNQIKRKIFKNWFFGKGFERKNSNEIQIIKEWNSSNFWENSKKTGNLKEKHIKQFKG